MKPEQMMGITFTGLGAAMGAASNFLGGIELAAGVPIAVYAAVMFLMTKVHKAKKINWILSNSLLTFLLVWVLVWILIFNV